MWDKNVKDKSLKKTAHCERRLSRPFTQTALATSTWCDGYLTELLWLAHMLNTQRCCCSAATAALSFYMESASHKSHNRSLVLTNAEIQSPEALQGF